MSTPETDENLLSAQQFEHLSQVVQRHFGIHLTDDKRVMLSIRMQKMMRIAGFSDLNSYFQDRLRAPSAETLSELVNHVSTNHTHFWREAEHFELYRDQLLPELLQRRERRGQRDLRVWCAAASTGEEPYTLAMLQRDVLGPRLGQWKAGLLATDISMRALGEASRGIYAADNVTRMPADLQRRYFRPHGTDQVQVVDALREDVLFRRLNLVAPTLPLRGDLDAIFCRNVMIYFDEATKRALVEQLYRLLTSGGYLLIGHAETLNNLGTRFQFVRPGIYRKG